MADAIELAPYVGRTIDVLAYAGVQAPGNARLVETLAQPGQGGEIVTGIQKLAQRFLIELFTEKGSLVYLPDRGNDFITAARQGYLRTQLDALTLLSAALIDIQHNLQGEETGSEPLDEQFASAAASGLIVTPGKLTMTITIASKAGSSWTFIQPIPVSL